MPITRSTHHVSPRAARRVYRLDTRRVSRAASQFWANVYLHPLDTLISVQLGERAYARYMDDVVVFGASKERLWHIAAEARRLLGETCACN